MNGIAGVSGWQEDPNTEASGDKGKDQKEEKFTEIHTVREWRG